MQRLPANRFPAHRFPANRFSRALSCTSGLWLSRAVFILLAIGIGFVGEAHAGKGSWRALMSPGPVGTGHSEIAGDCEQCHMTFSGVPDEKCLYCHTGIAERIDMAVGFHASVSDQDCVDCHTDHRGEDESLTREAARKDFDHDRTGFPLQFLHASLECSACHTGSIREMNSACADCHEDAHARTFGTDCGSCHIASSWPQMLKPLSVHEVPVHGGHEGLDCGDCHLNGDHLEPVVPCADCHQQAHGGTDSACDTCHQVEGFKPASFDHDACTCALPEDHQTGDCLSCHAGWNFVDTPTRCSACHAADETHRPLGECSQCHFATSWEKEGQFQHSRDSRFRLDGEHLGVSCDGCHGDLTDFRAVPEECSGCHAETGRVAHGDFGDCAGCHGTDSFENSTFDHSTTGFPLTGRHVDTPCQACHEAEASGRSEFLPSEPVFELVVLDVASNHPASNDPASIHPASSEFMFAQHDETSGGVRECVDCHDDVHGGSVGNDCASCHTTDVWSPSTFDVQRHSETALPLEGAHAQTDCAACHLGGQLKPLASDCASCHLDRHAGKLGDDCADCHNAVAFSPVPDFDHAVTGFELDGPHESLDCDSCHGPSLGPSMVAAEDATECGVCHVPTHSEDLGDNCESCHEPKRGVSFADARGMAFAHETTGFPLERRHSNLPCSSCHAVNTARPTGRCADCHLDPHAGGMSSECELCHQPDRWRLARFDHSSTGWPLRGRHQVTPCAWCHLNQRWVGVETDCFGCHALDAARAPQNANHAFGATDCADCHSLWGWRIR